MARPAASLRALAVARGNTPADLLVTGGRVFVPSTREWVETELAITDGAIAGWGPRDAIETVDVAGAALTPAFIDAHMHLESTKLWVDEFVRAVLPWGTTAVAADPHEIANVLGIAGVAALAVAAERLPFTFGVAASSCVAASMFESPGAEVDADDVAALLRDHGAIGVAEVMNFPGVIAGDPELRAKIAAAGHRRVDGRASVSFDTPPGPEVFDRPVPPRGQVRVIGVEAGSLTTTSLAVDLTGPKSGVARLAVVERHRRTGRVGLGWVQGFGLSSGAIASTVGHDAHNCMVIGAAGPGGPADMAAAVGRLAELGGGQVVVRDGRVLAEVALPIAGLMSDRPASEVAGALQRLTETAAQLGVTLEALFMHLSFLGLSVIPRLRLTDLGLVDVDRFELVPVEID